MLAILLMATYFIAASGNDSNNGTSSATPWLTIGKVNGHAQNPGDTFQFNGGDTFNDAVLAITSSGSAGSPITFGSYGTGNAIFSCGNVSAVTISNASYVTIQDLTMTGVGVNSSTGKMSDGSNNKAFAIDVKSTLSAGSLSNIILKRCTISGVYGGVLVHADAASTPVGYATVTIGGDTTTPFVVHDALAMGIWTYGSLAAHSSGTPLFLPTGREHSLITVQYAKVYNIYGIPSALDNRVNYWGSGIVLSNVTGTKTGDNLIQYCEVHDNGKLNDDSRGGPVNCWAIEADYTTIQYVEAHHGMTNGADGGGIDFDGGCNHCIAYANYTHNNKSVGFMTGTYPGESGVPNDITFKFNISESDTTGALTTFNGFAKNVLIERNTFYTPGLAGTTSEGVIVTPNVTGLTWTIRNNIFITNDAGNLIVQWSNVAAIDGNLYWSTASTPNWRSVDGGGVVTSLAAWQATTGSPDPNGQNADPKESPGTGGTIGNYANMNTSLTAYDPSATSPANSGAVAGSTGPDFHKKTLAGGFASPVGAVNFHGVSTTSGISRVRLQVGM